MTPHGGAAPKELPDHAGAGPTRKDPRNFFVYDPQLNRNFPFLLTPGTLQTGKHLKCGESVVYF